MPKLSLTISSLGPYHKDTHSGTILLFAGNIGFHSNGLQFAATSPGTGEHRLVPDGYRPNCTIRPSKNKRSNNSKKFADFLAVKGTSICNWTDWIVWKSKMVGMTSFNLKVCGESLHWGGSFKLFSDSQCTGNTIFYLPSVSIQFVVAIFDTTRH